jgi:hypothetical protein
VRYITRWHHVDYKNNVYEPELVGRIMERKCVSCIS